VIWVRKDLFEQDIISTVYNIRKKVAKSSAQTPGRILRLIYRGGSKGAWGEVHHANILT